MNGEMLVRDGILRWQSESGDTRPVRKASDEELPDLFRRKLQEELEEYLESGDFSKLCDLIDVAFHCASLVHESDVEEVSNAIFAKHSAMGKFFGRFVLGEREGK